MSEAYLCDAIRTPIGRYGGALSDLRVDDLASVPVKSLMERNARVDWSQVDDLIMGCANQAGEDNRNVARMAALLADMPVSVSATTVNRLCGSGLDAIGMASRAIKSGECDLMIAAGVEGMSRAPFVMPKAGAAFSRQAEIYDTTIGWRFTNKVMHEKYGSHSMPQTADHVAEDFGISRADQDAFAARSQARWEAAHNAGRFDEEIIPVTIPQRKGAPVIVTVDEHPRPGTSVEKLSGLKGVNGPDLTVTAGNSSGVNDGAAAVLLASEQMVSEYNLTPKVRIVAMAAAGVEPRIMGVGPVPAVRRVLQKTGLALGQMDLIELNEAFAAQAIAVLRELGLPEDADHINPNGGAISMGHPLGMSGTRLVTTAAYQLRRMGGRFALCTMCIGVGQGIAIILESAD